MAQFLDKQGLTTYSNLIKGELDALDARIEALENGGKYMPISGGTFTGNVTMGSGAKLSGIVTPVNDNDAVNKAYVDKPRFTVLKENAYYGSLKPDGSFQDIVTLTSLQLIQPTVFNGTINGGLSVLYCKNDTNEAFFAPLINTSSKEQVGYLEVLISNRGINPAVLKLAAYTTAVTYLNLRYSIVQIL